MSAKEYCQTHEPIAFYASLGEATYIHGVEYGINDYAYISVVYGSMHKYHKLRINYSSGRPHVFLYNNVKMFLDLFTRVSDDFVITNKED